MDGLQVPKGVGRSYNLKRKFIDTRGTSNSDTGYQIKYG